MPTVYDYRQYYPYGPDGGKPRPLPDHFDDSINIKDYARGDGEGDTPGIETFITKLASGYTHSSSNLSASARSGYIPPGIFEADAVRPPYVIGHGYTIITAGTTDFTLIGAYTNIPGTNFVATGAGTGTGTARPLLRSVAYSWTLDGAGPLAQLQDMNVALDYNRCVVQNINVMAATSADQPGAGVDIRSSLNFLFNVDVHDRDFGIRNSDSFVAGGFSSNNTVIGGWLRGNKVNVAAGQNDLRLCFVRGSDHTEAGIDFFDGGGIHVVGCNFGTTNFNGGPAMRFRGKIVVFTGDTVAAGPTISNISDFSGIDIGDIITSGAAEVHFEYYTRVIAIDEVARTLTITPVAITTNTALSMNITNHPAESFFVNNTFNCTEDSNLYTHNIVSIVQGDLANASILVTLADNHFGILIGQDRCVLHGTSNSFYNDRLDDATAYILELPSPTTVRISIPYVGNATGGTITFTGFDMEILSETRVDLVKDHFWLGSNINKTIFQGGLNFNLIGTRMNSKIYFDGVRPFFGTRTLGSAQITDIDIPTSEIRVGLPLSGTGIPAGSTVVSIDSPTSITISKASTSNSVTRVSSPFQPSNIFHIPVITSGTINDVDVQHPKGPGSLLGWGQLGMFPLGAKGYIAIEGAYYVGARVPYTQAGLFQSIQPIDLNYYGITNNAFRFRTNGTQYDVQGHNFKVGDGVINFEENWFDANSDGLLVRPTGTPMFITARAYMGLFSQPFTGDIYAPFIGNTHTSTLIDGIASTDNIPVGGNIVGSGIQDGTIVMTKDTTSITISLPTTSTIAGTSIGITFMNNISIGAYSIRIGQLLTGAGIAAGTRVVAIRNESALVMSLPATTTRTNGTFGQIKFGNSIYRMQAPRSDTVGGNSATGGYLVLPGNDVDPVARVFLGATNILGSEVNLIGDANSIIALGGELPAESNTSIGIASNGRISAYFNGDEFFRLSSTISNSYINVDQDASTRFFVANPNAGAAAVAAIGCRQVVNNAATGVRIEVYGTGFTTAGVSVADGAAVFSDTQLSGGLSIAALAGTLRIYAGSRMQFVGLPTTAGGAGAERVWVDATVLKYS